MSEPSVLRRKFNHFNLSRQHGRVSPHKVCMLLAVMDLISYKTIRDNKIFFDDEFYDGGIGHYGKR